MFYVVVFRSAEPLSNKEGVDILHSLITDMMS